MEQPEIGGSPRGITLIGGRGFRWGERTYVMGIINLTPDSFSGDGLGSNVEAAVAQAWSCVAEGADIVDLGGESTRPGAEPVTPAEELRRVMPALERIAREIPLPVSIDTYKAEVARPALEAGASLINDVWGLARDPGLAQLAAEKGVPLILNSNQRDNGCQDVIPEVTTSLKESLDRALRAGVEWENIILDPGIGFGKTLEQNLEILRRFEEFRVLGRPLLLGTSRKSVIGLVLDLLPEERLEGTAATVAIGIAKGADMVRVHDVRQMQRVCRMSDAIFRRGL